MLERLATKNPPLRSDGSLGSLIHRNVCAPLPGLRLLAAPGDAGLDGPRRTAKAATTGIVRSRIMGRADNLKANMAFNRKPH
jgi:hypothetical protein